MFENNVLVNFMNSHLLKILFVCTGNICRSPTAEVVLNKLARQQGLVHRLQFDSAGTHAYHVGEAPDKRSQKYAASRQYDLSGKRARQVNATDYVKFDYLLAMDQENLSVLRERCPSEYQHKLALFLEFTLALKNQSVPDPYYGEARDFELVLDLCEQAGHVLLQNLAE